MKQRVLITGASGGIGSATARLFALRGHPVVLHYNRSRERAFSLAQEITAAGGQAHCIQADLAASDQVGRMFDEAEKLLDGIDVLVNNAGLAWAGLLADMSDEDWHRLRAVDLDAVFYCCRRAIPFMVRQKSGSIVNIASMWGLSGASCEAAYSAMKAGVIGLTKALAKELGPSGVRVNALAPGLIDTSMNANLTPDDLAAICESTPFNTIGTPEQMAECVYFLACSAGFVTGHTLLADGGLTL